jgi:predicted secreted hydrolase
LLFAHAAVADVRHARLRHDQRAARAGFGLAEASEATTAIAIDDWSLALAEGQYSARIAARDFALDLAFAPTQPVLLHGDAGVSQKAPSARNASYYYSEPHLRMSGTVTIAGNASRVTGTAWLDHEWSSELMAREAAGWDWVGLNFADGGALMAFRMRDRDGVCGRRNLRLRGGEARPPPGRLARNARGVLRATSSISVDAARRRIGYELEPLLEDQDLDSRASTGRLYWEGAVRARSAGREVGRGYLELTGYGKALRL